MHEERGRGGCNNFVAISNSLRAASTRWKATGRSIGTFIDETWSNEIKKWLGFNRFVNDEFFPRSNFHHLISPLAYPRGKLQTNREKEYLKRLKFNSENLRKLIYARIETYWNSFFVKWKRTRIVRFGISIRNLSKRFNTYSLFDKLKRV